MRQMLKDKLKEQKGLTLIELLAVIVILGIIAAIAVPSILGLIDNSKKDAHVANAQQLISATKMAIASEADLQTGTDYLNLKQLETKNYLDEVNSPDSAPYAKGDAADDYSSTAPVADNVSFVKIVEGKIVEVNLISKTTGTGAAKKRFINETATEISKTAVSASDITRSDVEGTK